MEKKETTDSTEKTEKSKKTEKSEKKHAGADLLLNSLGGCGFFQIILTLMVTFSHVPDSFTFQLMSVAIYNPGYKCLDTNLTFTNESLSTNNSCSAKWERSNCTCFDSCEHVEFNPQTKTLVTEWGLACNRFFIMSTTLAISHAGGIFANFIVGYVGDRYGRKGPLIASKFLQAAVNIAIAFSPSWEIHAVLLFILGFIQSFSTLLSVLVVEYTPSDWRIKIYSLPTGAFFSTVFALTAMYTEDWKILRYIAGITGFIFIIPLIWVPRSLRWLSVNGRNEEAHKVATRIAKMNKVEPPTKEKLDSMVKKKDDGKTTNNTTILDLFRKGYRLPTFAMAFISFAMSLVYFVVQFGIAALPGNVYINLIIVHASDLPANLLSYFLANRFKRRPIVFSFFAAVALCYLGIVVLALVASEDERRWGMISIVMVARVFLINGWIFLATIRMEVYPTVARSTLTSFCHFVGAIGGTVSPYLIPKDESTFWISYLCLAALIMVCALLILTVPETKDKPLKDTWDETNTKLSFKMSKKMGSEKKENQNGVV